MTTVRALAFGDAGAWGVAWLPGDGATISLAGAAGAAAGTVAGELTRAGESEPWRIEDNRTSLLLAPAGPVGRAGALDGAVGSMDQLCMVSGTVSLDGDDREINSLGWRSTLTGNLDLDRIESFRQTSAWFEPIHGFSLVALRPRKSQGQDADLMAAVLLEGEATPPVADPRLSTTYDAAGLPARVGLELWLEEQDAAQAETNRHYPRRAAGEAMGGGVDWRVAGFTLHAALLRWHSRGIEGTGIYLLGRRD